MLIAIINKSWIIFYEKGKSIFLYLEILFTSSGVELLVFTVFNSETTLGIVIDSNNWLIYGKNASILSLFFPNKILIIGLSLIKR